MKFLRMVITADARRAVLSVMLLAFTPLAQAQRQAPEPELKAAILANILLFVDWPIQASQPTDRLTLCYLDNSPVTMALDRLDGKTIKGKPLQVIRVSTERVTGCHALYVTPDDSIALKHVLPGLRTSGVLFVGDSPGYAQRNVMLNLEVDDGRIVFDVDLRTIRQAGLFMSSKVLRLARKVVE